MLTRPARLPGIRFEVQPPAPAFILPRMDIAVFVGFAASGPLNVPVAVEDAAHFRSIFGDDLPLAWDARRGAFEMAYLAPAVRAFFQGGGRGGGAASGGRRCYVIRVAGQAQANRWPIPGLLHAGPDGRLNQAFIQARSPGSWSDLLEVGAETLIQPVQLLDIKAPEGSRACWQAVLALARAADVQPGDLLRFNCKQVASPATVERYQFMVVPDTIQALNGGAGARIQIQWSGGRWFRLPGLPAVALPGRARIQDPAVYPSGEGGPGWVTAWLPQNAGWSPENAAWSLQNASWSPGKPVPLALDIDPAQAPQAGSLVEVEWGGERLWLVVLSTQAMRSLVPGSADGLEPAVVKDHLVITGSGLWESQAPAGWPGDLSGCFVERLRMRLVVKKAGASFADRLTTGELGYARAHASFWNALPTDAALYVPYPPGRSNPYAGLWKAAAEPRFPLAGLPVLESAIEEESAAGELPAEEELAEPDYPLPLPIAANLFAGPLKTTATALERSGLERFSLDLFLDPLLQDCGVETLRAQADFLSYQSAIPHDPQGIYAALRLEEATLIAAPDVLHTGWARDFTRPEPLTPLEPPAPDISCTPPLAESTPGSFSDRFFLGQPALTVAQAGETDTLAMADAASSANMAAAAATLHLEWTLVEGPVDCYRLEEALAADFTDAVTLYLGPQRSLDVTGRGPGAYYYRVRAESSAQPSPLGSPAPGWFGPWSQGVGIRLGAARPWQTLPPESFDENSLARFHTALLTLCAARSDLFAVLSLPPFYHEDQALRYASRLQTGLRESDPRALSFGAIYHPWAYVQQEDQAAQPLLIPPDGPVVGAYARRTLARGAWLAVANEPLAGLLALEPRMAAGRLLDLQEGSLNILRQEPRGFMTLSELTLSTESEYRPIHVRRLLMLLRRLVQREGAAYVFEPNSAAFRRQVQRGFEDVLAGLFQRGAFSGGVPERAYQVDVGDRLNPPASLEQGRLIVEIRVAPSQPLMFLTVRLVMSGAAGLQIQEAA